MTATLVLFSILALAAGVCVGIVLAVLYIAEQELDAFERFASDVARADLGGEPWQR